jgi:hypothetical protein
MTGPFDPMRSSGSGYEVYPESLRKATEDIYHAVDFFAISPIET